jgi:hypothetical protein
MKMVVGRACACENGKGKRPSRTVPWLAAHRAIGDQLDGQTLILRNVNLADAKAHLSKLVEWAAAGDTGDHAVAANRCSRHLKRRASGSISQRFAR